MQYAWREVILVQSFCPLKIKITQFPNRFHLNPSLHEIAKVRIKGAVVQFILLIMPIGV